MTDERPIVFLVVKNDKYELPVFCGDSTKEVADFLGLSGSQSVAARLVQSKTGIVTTQNRKYKYMRLDPRNGKLYIGKLPKDVHTWCTAQANIGKPKTHRAIIAKRGSTETRYANIHEAAAAVNMNKDSLYKALKCGGYCCGAYWRYE